MSRLIASVSSPARLAARSYSATDSLSIEDRQAAEQRLAAYGAAMMGGQIGQRSGEGILARRPVGGANGFVRAVLGWPGVSFFGVRENKA